MKRNKQIKICIILMFLIGIMIFYGISLVSADNTKTYDSATNKIIIKDNLGVSKLAEYKLTKNTDFCLYDCYAEGTATLFNNNYLFTGVTFNDINRNEKTIPYSIKIKSGDKWIDYKNNILNAGTYTWQIKGTKNFYETIDWIGSAYGLSFTEWAFWSSSFNNGLSAYWSFDNSTAITSKAVDIWRGKYNITIGNSTGWVAGILGNAYSGNNTESINMSFRDDLEGRTNMTINLWIKRTGDWNNSGVIISKYDIAPANGFYGIERQANTNKLQMTLYDTGLHYVYTPDALLLNQWYMVTMILNATHQSMYINGTLVKNQTTAGFIPDSYTPYLLSGYDHSTANLGYNITIDEMGFWNRTLNESEITYLYNSGSGVSAFGGVVTLNSPPAISIDLINIFNCSSSQQGNFTLSIDGTQTYSLNNSLSFSIPQTLSFGGHTWDCNFTNVNGTGSGSRTLNIVNFLENSQTFNSTTYELQSEGFVLNMSYVGSYYSGISANLVYNNTEYSGTKVGSGNHVLFVRTLSMPSITSQVNNTFYWKIALTNSSGTFYFNSSSHNQTVNNFAVDDCSSYTNVLMNISLKDEASKVLLGSSGSNIEIELDYGGITYYNNFTNRNNISICLSNLTYGNTLDTTIKYYSTGKVVEYYYIDNHVVTSGELPFIINLYDLNSSDSDSYLNTYKDCSYLNVKGAIIETWRKYISEGSFYLVEMSKTNEVGQAVSHLVSEDIVYKYIIRLNGEIQYTTPEFNALCISTPCQINIIQKGAYCDSGSFEGYQSDPTITYTLDYNETTRYLTFEYSTNDGTPATLSMTVTKFDNYFNSTACSTSLTSAGGTLSCTLLTSLTNSTYYVEITKNGKFLVSAFISTNTDAIDVFGRDGVLYTFLLILTLSLAFISTGWGVLIAGILGFLVASLLSLISWNWTLLIYLCIAVIIILIKISKKVDSG